jgi:ATPase family associated with various cellular activities (AAA)/AAA lid domain
VGAAELREHGGVMSSVLVDPVAAFVDAIAEPLSSFYQQAGRSSAQARDDIGLEAFSLCCAMADADGRHTDDELWALLAAFGPRFPTQLSLATPDDVRRAGLLTGKRAWLNQPSAMFDLLVKSDVQKSTSFAWTYYRQAMDLAQLVVALDARPTETELRVLDSFRTMLVGTIERAGVGRPGAPKPAVVSAQTGSPSTTNEPPIATTPEPEPLPPPEPIEDLLVELDALIGLIGVKAEVRLVTNLLQVQKLRKERNLPVVEGSRHLVFTGNPGTGKTTVARLLARIYRTLGVVEKGHLVETDRAGLVAGFVGQTALKVTEKFDEAMGGVLLIDEAYALARGGERDFGREAIDTLVKLIEDRRDALAVIAAGYPDEMSDFIDSNPGLRSRFPKTIEFADYSSEELVKIFTGLCKKNRYEPTDDALVAARTFFDKQDRTKGFGNGRVARNMFESAVAAQASRLMLRGKDAATPTDNELLALEAADIGASATTATNPNAVPEVADGGKGSATKKSPGVPWVRPKPSAEVPKPHDSDDAPASASSTTRSTPHSTPHSTTHTAIPVSEQSKPVPDPNDK